MPAEAVVLFEDETIVRLFPGLRRAWSFSGEQAGVGISGCNDRRVLFGTINMHTGHRIIGQYRDMRQGSFQSFLQLLRRNYRHRQLWLILDKAGCHTTWKSQQLAEALDIKLIWLPKQCPELNAMDHLWRHLKRDVSANHQYKGIEEHVQTAMTYLLKMIKQDALKKAGIHSENFWLKSFLK
jgi:transposase